MSAEEGAVQGEHDAYYHALYRVACLVNSTLDLQATLEAVVKSVAEAMEARACALRLLDRQGKVLELVASVGLSERYLNKGAVEVSASPIDREAITGKTVSVGDVVRDTRLQYREELTREGIASILCAPLIRHQHPIGVMRVYTSERHTFASDEVEFLQALSDICALAIENSRMFDALHRTYHESMEALWGGDRR
jgi:signal transduction protein with GAF and PtsI domain